MKKLITLLLLFPICITAQKNYASLIDKFLVAKANVNDFSGSVLVAQKGRVLYKKAFGLANREWNVPNTVETKFRIGSLTKQFTSSAILQLVDQGKISLDDKLTKFFPDFPNGDNVTVHMLLNHTSGIKSYTGIPSFASIASLPYTRDSVVALIKRYPYDYTPGTRYSYNNSAYFLLGYIIEKISGKPYSNYLMENVISKAGLKNTAYNKLDSILKYRANGYIKTPVGWRNADYISMEFPFSAGALFSTVDDLYQWNKALFTGKIVPASLFTRMTTPYLNNYGYGLRVDSLQDHKGIGHGGVIPGFNCYSIYYPAEDLYVVVLSNNNSDATAISKSIAAIVFDMPVVTPYTPKEVNLDASIISRYQGLYKRNNFVDTLRAREGKLFIRLHGSSREFELKPESETTFFVVDFPDRKIEFEVDKKGMVTKTYTFFGGTKTEIVRIKEN